jgi:hypothetical protein
LKSLTASAVSLHQRGNIIMLHVERTNTAATATTSVSNAVGTFTAETEWTLCFFTSEAKNDLMPAAVDRRGILQPEFGSNPEGNCAVKKNIVPISRFFCSESGTDGSTTGNDHHHPFRQDTAKTLDTILNLAFRKLLYAARRHQLRLYERRNCFEKYDRRYNYDYDAADFRVRDITEKYYRIKKS